MKTNCRGKVSYRTNEEAWLAAYKFFKTYGREQSPYVCRECREWHLTSKKGFIPKNILEIIEAIEANQTK